MPTKKSIDERISELQIKQNQLREQEKRLRAKRTQADRKKEAHRKIVIGGAVESVLGRPIEETEVPKLLAFLRSQEERGGYFTKAMSNPVPEEQG